MTHPGVIIVTGVVIAFAAVLAIFATKSNTERPMRYDRRRRRSRSPSPDLKPPSSFTNHREPPTNSSRQRSPPSSSSTGHPEVPPYTSQERSSSTGHREVPSHSSLRRTCQGCHKSSFIKVNPCGHESLCERCFKDHLETNDTCPDCSVRIDSCSPDIVPFGKCKKCRRFTKLFKFLDCDHSLSMCISCFEDENRTYKNCPQCSQVIRGSEPSFRTSGICGVCYEFTRFAMFQPCGHRSFCRKHAELYLERCDYECSECGKQVTKVV